MKPSQDIPALRPTVDELLEAVQEHLSSAVAPTLTDPRLRFRTLVAAHVVGVVRRELLGGAEARETIAVERSSLPSSPSSDLELCASIAAGRYDDPVDGARLREHLRHRVEAMLMAWNPLFLHRVSGG